MTFNFLAHCSVLSRRVYKRVSTPISFNMKKKVHKMFVSKQCFVVKVHANYEVSDIYRKSYKNIKKYLSDAY